MPLTINCPRCETPISAQDEDSLVQKVQTHVRQDHGLAHTLPRKHILARLHKLTQEKEPVIKSASPGPTNQPPAIADARAKLATGDQPRKAL